jgi:synaptosomal-associated protein 29
MRSMLHTFAYDTDEPPSTSTELDKQSQRMENQLDDNLADLQMGLGRLKNLALGLGQEISDQNEYLDKITTKSERVDDTIKIQNKQMQKHLKR